MAKTEKHKNDRKDKMQKMGQFRTLFFYEMKKIAQRKNTWITFGALLVLFLGLIAGRQVGSTYINGEFLETKKEGFAIDRENGLKFSGRKLDDKLITEVKNAYALMAGKDTAYLLMEEYRKNVRPYSGIDNIISAYSEPASASEENFYAAREAVLKGSQDDYKLSEAEKEYWQGKEEKVEKPFTYQYADAYSYLDSMNGIYLVLLMVSFMLAICMSNVFTEEHGRKTDQLILCTRLGRKQTYFAKIFAGSVFSFVTGLLFLAIVTVGAFISFGTEGFSAALQLMYGNYSYPMTLGQVFLVMAGIHLLACILTGVFAMVLSEITKSSIGTMATVVAILFLARLIPVPPDWRLSQAVNFFPINILKLDAGFTDMRLVSIFGLKFTSWQFAPLLYIFLIVLLFFTGKKVYCRFQVQGR